MSRDEPMCRKDLVEITIKYGNELKGILYDTAVSEFLTVPAAMVLNRPSMVAECAIMGVTRWSF